MHAPILVTGGTGTIGRRVVPLLVASGRQVRVLSRHPRPDSPGVTHLEGDTVADRGLEAATDGVEVVVHLAGGRTGDDLAARHVAAAARAAGVRHLLLVSVVGADRMPIGYFRAKAAAEQAVAGSGVPWTVLRVAQLHDLVLPVARAAARLPVTPAPRGLRFEPVHRDEVARRLADLALGEPAGRVPDLAGPEVLDLAALVASFREAEDRRPARRLPLPLAGAVGRAYREGANLAGPDARRGTRTWQEFLTATMLDSFKSAADGAA
ncbi:SDR family oxidoreductase [Actinotalea caeni]|uniref:SDR family oxidoreductase n=1 Tax=Actinotalea caeni TaxID=1348467 RepID=UPI0012E2BE70|nr:SDR family oxidoreductase [Actinotalea caeni]